MDYKGENELSETILGCAIEVHKQLGHRLLESAYHECFYYELLKSGFDIVAGKTNANDIQISQIKSRLSN
jgi:GxxExxY protein